MNVVASSGWLEYLANGPNAAFFAPAIEKTSQRHLPSLTLYAVCKRILQQREEGHALEAVAAMEQGRVIDLDAPLALVAARISMDHGLPMADSVVLATARTHRAVLWTQDADFKGLAGVKYRAHRTRGREG